jgi:hypothetical protein
MKEATMAVEWTITIEGRNEFLAGAIPGRRGEKDSESSNGAHDDHYQRNCRQDRKRAWPDQGSGARRSWKRCSRPLPQHPGLRQVQDQGNPEREARNPTTVATIKIAAAKKLTLAPAKALKDALNK